MINNIINTISSRLIMALISLALLLLNSNYLGAAGLGTVGLLILGVSIFVLVSNFANGGGLVYFAPRHSTLKLFLIANAWTIVMAILFGIGILLFPDFLGQYAWDVLFLGLILSLASTNTNLLLGKEKVKRFNQCFVLQSIVQVGGLVFYFFYLQDQTVEAFVRSTYIAYSLNFLLSLIYLLPFLNSSQDDSITRVAKSLIHYGFYLQLANLFQLFNYRLSYYLLEFYSGKAAVGIYSSGIQLSEGVLLPSKSLGMVQYSKISNMNNDHEAAKLSMGLMKVAFYFTFPIILLLLVIPTSAFVAVLGEDFEAAKLVIISLSVGILALAMEGILGRFFSGTGKQQINTINTGIGLVFTLGFGLWLIPIYGVYGAAITASISYLSMFLFISYQLKSKAELSFKAFLPHRSDFKIARELVLKRLKKE